ncbi:MAG: hypothetical protein KIT79_11025 [Deltaproteobacteria bacterium]|nr:hypothetical protein [Deltaproteobacteria bacterium]
MARFDDLLNGFMGQGADTGAPGTDAGTLGDLWERIRRLTPAKAMLAAPLLFATAGIAVLGLLAAAIFGAAALVLLETLLGNSPAPGPAAQTVH